MNVTAPATYYVIIPPICPELSVVPRLLYDRILTMVRPIFLPRVSTRSNPTMFCENTCHPTGSNPTAPTMTPPLTSVPPCFSRERPDDLQRTNSAPQHRLWPGPTTVHRGQQASRHREAVPGGGPEPGGGAAPARPLQVGYTGAGSGQGRSGQDR